MSEENVEVVRRVLSRLDERDVEGALQDVAHGAELDWSDSEALDSGVHHGHARWRDFLAGRWNELSEMSFDPIEVIGAGDRVVTVTRVRARGRASGVETEALGAAIWTLRNGKVTRLRLYQTRDQALKAVGLEG